MSNMTNAIENNNNVGHNGWEVTDYPNPELDPDRCGIASYVTTTATTTTSTTTTTANHPEINTNTPNTKSGNTSTKSHKFKKTKTGNDDENDNDDDDDDNIMMMMGLLFVVRFGARCSLFGVRWFRLSLVVRC
mmetsp:Transcript_30111/g.33733  ORF Transcript_30111/g.33733 Transcript_30111/m.33733 type:complete len:133 (-) Transcript_30111:16-414(-)